MGTLKHFLHISAAAAVLGMAACATSPKCDETEPPSLTGPGDQTCPTGGQPLPPSNSVATAAAEEATPPSPTDDATRGAGTTEGTAQVAAETNQDKPASGRGFLWGLFRRKSSAPHKQDGNAVEETEADSTAAQATNATATTQQQTLISDEVSPEKPAKRRWRRKDGPRKPELPVDVAATEEAKQDSAAAQPPQTADTKPAKDKSWWRKKKSKDTPEEPLPAKVVEGVSSNADSEATLPTDGHSDADAVVASSPKIRSGIKLDVVIFLAGETEYDEQEKRVEVDGSITLPLVGRVMASGKTLAEFREELTSLYDKNFLINPQVVVDFSNDSEIKFAPWGSITVLGAVGRPGKVHIPATQALTLSEALQEAGGLTKVAKVKSIMVTSVDKTGRVVKKKVNLHDIDKNGVAAADRRLNANDVVFVPETIF